MTRGTSAARRRAAIVFAGLAAVVTATAQQQTPAFRFERPVTSKAPGPQRLAIDVPLLAGGAPFTVGPAAAGRFVARGGLSDLRFFDQSGAAVGYLLLYPPVRQPVWTAAEVLPIAQSEKTSGFEADLGAAAPVDAIRVSGIPAPFLKRLTLEGSGDRAHWTMLAAQGTMFDLPEEGLRQIELPFASGTYRYLRVTWNDTNSGRVPMPAAVEARSASGVAPSPALTTTVPVERRPSEPRRSRYRIKLPAAHLPVAAVDLEAGGGHVFRDAMIFESRLSGGEASPSQLGRATLKRVVRDGVTAGSLRIPVSQPSEATLDVVIEDGANPPLEVTGATIVFAELPWIYLEAPRGALVARYGGGASGTPPTYDLEAVRDSIDAAVLPEATWGEPRVVAESPSGTPAPEVSDAGAPIDPGTFTYNRAIPAGGAGLVALALDAAVLAHSRGPAARFADVRIIDSTRHQVPYVIERRDEPVVIDLPHGPADGVPPDLRTTPGHNRSVYAIALPYGSLPGASLAVETTARVFQRPVQLGVARPPDRRNRDAWFDPFDTTVWTHSEPDTPAPAILLSVRQSQDTRLLLAVDEGDNSPLPIIAVRLLLPSYRLRFYRSAGAAGLQLVYGRDDIAPPRYDIALLAPQVMGAVATEVGPGPEAGRGTAPVAPLISPRLFWGLLVLAVLVLVAIIGRLVRT